MPFSLPENLTKWPPENDSGYIEYKSFLSSTITDLKIDKMITQLQWRLSEGMSITNRNIAYYVIGVYDRGNSANLTAKELQESLKIMKAVCSKARHTIRSTYVLNAGTGYIAIMCIKGSPSAYGTPYYDYIVV